MKNVSLLAIGGILGAMTIRGDANASIVSRNFLENALTDYAKTTALDLKADKTDVTDLSDKIGTLPSAILPSAWTDIPYYSEKGVIMPGTGLQLPPTLGEQLEFLLNGGAESPIERMFRVMTIFGGNVNGDDDPGADFLGLHPLTQKVKNIEENITLPDGLTVANLYNGWKTPNGEYINGLSSIAQANFTTYDPVNDTYYTGRRPETGGSLDALARLFFEDGYFRGDSDTLAPFWYLTKQAMRVGDIPRDKTAAGMIDEINTKIGTLPSGNFPEFPEFEGLFSQLGQPLTYPTSLAELINAIYGNSETSAPGLLASIILGFDIDTDDNGITDSTVGTIPNFWAARYANNLASANATKIGTVPDGKNLAGMIGTLPAGYDSVGAALTAIKGIAEEAKAAAVAAIPDPKTEGSTGKFVLTVDIVGDNATYRWEKIDRSESESTTTE